MGKHMCKHYLHGHLFLTRNLSNHPMSKFKGWDFVSWYFHGITIMLILICYFSWLLCWLNWHSTLHVVLWSCSVSVNCQGDVEASVITILLKWILVNTLFQVTCKLIQHSTVNHLSKCFFSSQVSMFLRTNSILTHSRDVSVTSRAPEDERLQQPETIVCWRVGKTISWRARSGEWMDSTRSRRSSRS